MANVYTGFLVASITAYQAPPPFTDLKTMVKQTEYTFGMMRGSAFFRWMNVSEEAKQMKKNEIGICNARLMVKFKPQQFIV